MVFCVCLLEILRVVIRFCRQLQSVDSHHVYPLISGYGTRSPDSGCPEALLVVMLQATIGVIIQALMTGMLLYL